MTMNITNYCVDKKERAARELCLFAGNNPDDYIRKPLQGGAAIITNQKLWTKYLPAVEAVIKAMEESNGEF